MKKLLFVVLVLISVLGFSQNNYIVKTDDGRRVLLKADYTWEYIDQQPAATGAVGQPAVPAPIKGNACHLAEGYEEPVLNKKIQGQLKKGRATLAHVKKKVAKDYNCTVEDVVLMAITETPRVSKYTFCAKGEKVYYKRNGHKILEKGKFF